ncbi:hypothetical protein GA0061071_12222 [Kosakonia oryzendophytica]|uniref:DUF4238 domain-containing protein n=1 Tax=Kosakonia oryzendophytica TaxID=1005665 RepID=A0A1C4EC87_9ENTR|nr:hypothetical protein [Kosakonia oryzendophytica]SCC41229.1 hypothetical protein GA0061071_12222 [Kosakonia oryzendophytica]
MRKKKQKVSNGICKLTLKEGRFVESHILPKSLTLLNSKGERAIQTSLNGFAKKRFPGWYDNQLCIAEGEEILSKIDDSGIKALRNHLLIWSGWPKDMHSLNTNDCLIDHNNYEEGIGLRAIKNIDWKAVKLFILSLLWRAAASERDEMSEIKLPDPMLEKLRKAIIEYDALSVTDFPVNLYQIGDKGAEHNRTPILEKIDFVLPPPYGTRVYNVCRIYLDGMIAYVTLDPDEDFSEIFKSNLLGYDDSLLVFVHKFDKSRSRDNLITIFSNQRK